MMVQRRSTSPLPSAAMCCHAWRVVATRAPSIWRKRMGVEPTWDRLTAPPGFEDQSPHRGTPLFLWRRDCNSPLLVFARNGRFASKGVGQPMACADATRKADAVEELEDLDGALASAADEVAEICCPHAALET